MANNEPATNYHAARSFHTGGVNAAIADGAVRFVPQTVDLNTWRILCSTESGQSASL
jgi:hypothetical protein